MVCSIYDTTAEYQACMLTLRQTIWETLSLPMILMTAHKRKSESVL
jgi:hypothetical protein